jgi:hypothetical protein
MYVHKLFSVTSVILNKLNLPETQMYKFILANHLFMDYPKDQNNITGSNSHFIELESNTTLLIYTLW